MNILITNDDGYTAPGIKTLVEILRPFGKITVIAPKFHQSGMSMAVTMGLKPIAVKELERSENETWIYVDGTPASCVKYGIDIEMENNLPDIVVSGINHGANTASAALYSGTLGAAKEASLAAIPAIGISIDDMGKNPDFSAVKELFPAIFQSLSESIKDAGYGVYYNVNFPKTPSPKGIKLAHMGINRWIKEFEPYDRDIYKKNGTTHQAMGITALPDVEDGETVYVMKGEIIDDPHNFEGADHHMNYEGYITITTHNIDSTDYKELSRLKDLGIEKIF